MGAGSAIPHLPALDGVRGVAILLVLFLHFGVAADFPYRAGGRLAEWADRLFYVGWSGVDLFFVLSGFLITSILLATKSDPQYFLRFYARRVLRIFPLYYLTLVLAFVAVPGLFPTALPPSLRAYEGQVWFWTYTSNIALVFGWKVQAEMVGHFWTLAIEEQYYLVWPWVVRRCSRKALLRICLGLIVGALALRVAWVAGGFGWGGAYRFTLTRLDTFGVGGLIAVLLQEARTRRILEKNATWGLLIAGAALTVIFLRVRRFYPSEWLVVTFGHSLLAIAFGCLTVTAVSKSPARWLQHTTLRALGKYSYGIYVWHWPLQRLLLQQYAETSPSTRLAGTLQAITFLVVGIGGSVISGWASYHAIEERFLRLKQLVPYRDVPSARNVERSRVSPSSAEREARGGIPRKPYRRL